MEKWEKSDTLLMTWFNCILLSFLLRINQNMGLNISTHCVCFYIVSIYTKKTYIIQEELAKISYLKKLVSIIFV